MRRLVADLLSRPRVRRALGLHSPSLAMFGQCGCRPVCHGETFDVGEIMREGFEQGRRQAVEALAALGEHEFRRQAFGTWPVDEPIGAESGPNVAHGEGIQPFLRGTSADLLDRIDSVVDEHESSWPAGWTWGPPSEAAFDRWE